LSETPARPEAAGPEPARPSAAAPLLCTRRVRLRPIGEQDRRFLYELMTSPESGGRVRFGGATPSPEKVAASLWESVLAQFVVESVGSGQPVGLVAITSPDFRNGFAYVSALGLPETQGSGLVAESAFVAFHYAFTTWPLRKVYMEATEDSFRAFETGLGDFFREEGRLVDHVFWNGRYVDMVILAVYRETWSRLAPRMVRLLTRRAEERES
jgi:RimJ/RimL family protein N-acetyltransferase